MLSDIKLKFSLDTPPNLAHQYKKYMLFILCVSQKKKNRQSLVTKGYQDKLSYKEPMMTFMLLLIQWFVIKNFQNIFKMDVK